MNSESMIRNFRTGLQLLALLSSGTLLTTETFQRSETKLLIQLTQMRLGGAVSFFYIIVPILLLFTCAAIFFLVCGRGHNLEKREILRSIFPDWSIDRVFFDIFLKATLLWIGVTAREPALVCALLTLFTADWVLQNRFFNLSGKFSVVLGAALYGDAIVRFLLDDVSMLPPLLVFVVISAVSTFQGLLTTKKGA